MHTTTPVRTTLGRQHAQAPDRATPSADAAVDDPWAASSVQADAPSQRTDAGTDAWGSSASARRSMDWLSAARIHPGG
jgi:hypothetical protein